MCAFTSPLAPGTRATHGSAVRPSVCRRARPAPAFSSLRRRVTWRALDNAPTPTPPPTQSGRTTDYHANVGSVIDQLREFYPKLFTAEPDLTYYSPKVVFADSTGHRVVGHDAYRSAFWMFRAQARVFFSTSVVSITSLYYDDASGTIYLRWRLQASPRGWALLAGPAMRGRTCVVLDGLSVYTLDYRGYVAVHHLENQSRRRSGLRHMFEDILAVGTVRVPGTPAGAGVGSGAPAGSGVPPWFRTVFETAENMSVSGDVRLEWDQGQMGVDLGCCVNELDEVDEEGDPGIHDKCDSIFMEPLLSH